MAEDREPDLVAGAEGVLGLPGRIRRGFLDRALHETLDRGEWGDVPGERGIEGQPVDGGQRGVVVALPAEAGRNMYPSITDENENIP